MDLRNKLCLSTIDKKAADLAREYGLGLELADYCWAVMLDTNYEKHLALSREKLRGIERRWLHAPFAELCPAAVDPVVREHTAQRYRQTIACAETLGILRIVFHSGFIPTVYYPKWFITESVRFWRSFLEKAPRTLEFALENVMEPDHSLTLEIVRQVDDMRFGLCLDVGHAATELSHMPVTDWVAPMAPYLKHLHLHNNLGKADLHSALGDGVIPMESVLEQTIALAPQADFTIENIDARPSLDWLRERGYL